MTIVNIAGSEVSIDELQKDLEAAVERRGLNFNHDFAFTCATVQGLIDKIKELTKEDEQHWPVDPGNKMSRSELRNQIGRMNFQMTHIRSELAAARHRQPKDVVKPNKFEKVVETHSESWLNNDGCVPAHSVCPFRIQCESAKFGKCHHLGLNHTVDFSCAIARAFDMVKK